MRFSWSVSSWGLWVEVFRSLFQTQVSGLTTNTMLRELRPETEYKVTVVPIYPDAEGQRMSENGKTSEFDPQSRSFRSRTGPGSNSLWC